MATEKMHFYKDHPQILRTASGISYPSNFQNNIILQTVSAKSKALPCMDIFRTILYQI